MMVLLCVNFMVSISQNICFRKNFVRLYHWFSPNNYKKNDKIIYKYFKDKYCITDCVSISAFTSLIAISVGITSSAIGLKICGITAGIKKYKSVTKK